jgi:hypothetical protein
MESTGATAGFSEGAGCVTAWLRLGTTGREARV